MVEAAWSAFSGTISVLGTLVRLVVFTTFDTSSFTIAVVSCVPVDFAVVIFVRRAVRIFYRAMRAVVEITSFPLVSSKVQRFGEIKSFVFMSL